MTWQDMAVVGRIVRPHGLDGHVIVNVETDFPEDRFRAGGELYVERAGRVERLTIAGVRFHQGRPIVEFVGVDRIEDAAQLRGLEVGIPVARLKPLPAGTFYHHDLAGCQVETKAGVEVGVVHAVEGDAASRLVVRSPDGAEILIPLASEICVGIDTAAKHIVIDPPSGLLELNGALGAARPTKETEG